MAKIYESRERAALNVALYPQAKVPLDLRDIFYSFEDFKAYVRQDKNYAPEGYDAADIQFLKDIIPYSYAGQVVAVVVNDVATLYKIDKVGGDVEGVNFSAIGGDVAADLNELTGKVNGIQSTVDAIPSTYQTKAINAVSGLQASTVQAALEELVAGVASNTNYIASHQVSFSTLANNVGSIDARVSTIEGAYASTEFVNNLISDYYTKEAVNTKVSEINNAIGSVDAKFSGYYTKGEVDGKVSTINGEISTINGLISGINEEISGIVEDLEDYAKISYVDAEISRVVEVAQGKTQTFVVNYADNEFLNSQEAELSAQQFVTIDGTAVAADTLKPGDVILVVETNVPDRWVKQVSERGDFVLAKLETTKVDLAPYATTEYVDAEISAVMVDLEGLSNRISAEVSRAMEAEAELGNRISVLEAKPFDTYASISYVDGKVAAEASARVSADEALDAKISAEVSRATGVEASLRTDVDHLLSQAVLSVVPTDNVHLSIYDNALYASVLVSHLELPNQVNLVSWAGAVDSTLSNHASRLSVLEAKPFDTYASISYVEGEIAKVAAAATKVEKSDINGNIKVDGAEVVVYNDEALVARVSVNEGAIAENAEAIASNAEHFTELQGTVASIDTRLTNLETEVSTVKDTYATKAELSAEANERAVADASLATRLALVEDSLGLGGGEGADGGIAEQIAAIKTEIWGSAEMSASSRIDNLEAEDALIKASILAVNSRLDANLLNDVVGGQYVSGTISGTTLTIDDDALVSVVEGINSAIASMASNPVVSIAMDGSQLSIAYHNGDASAFNLVEGVFGVSSIASNAVYLVSSETKVSTLNELTDGIANYGMSAMDVVYATQSHIMLSAANVGTTDIINTVQKAVTSVQTSTLVVSHSGNNLMINLPSVIWLDGGNAADSYDAEEALYNELLNNEYGE